jgi:chromosome segregation ATPase
VRYQEAHPSVLSAAAKLGGGKAQPALQLIGYEQEVEAAIKYAFGTTFVCQVSGRMRQSSQQLLLLNVCCAHCVCQVPGKRKWL